MTSYIYDMVDTWNAGATTFTAVKMNVTDTASAAGSLLMDLQVGGSSRFSVRKNGSTTVGGTGLFRPGAGGYIGDGGAQGILLQDSTLANSVYLGATANGRLRLGAADAAAPVAQTLSVQSVVAGTSNTAGANLTITGSQGTGTGAGGSIVFQVAPAGSSGTAQNALATALTIDSTRLATFAGNLSVPVGSFICTPNLLVGSGATAGLYLAGGDLRLYVDAATAKMAINSSETAIKAASTFAFSWTSASDASGTPDVLLRRDDANKLALRNGANNQELRVYGSYTSASVYDRLTLKSSSTVATIAAETDAGDMDLALTPAGTGNVRFGTHTGTADTAVSGYIEIKDAGGTIRKLAVIT